MNIMLAGMIGGWELVAIFGAILILFGAKKLPELARGLGQGIREFKKATREVSDEIQNAADDTGPAQQRRLPPEGGQHPDQTVPQGSSPGPKS